MENFLSSLGFDVITTIVSAFIIFLCRNFIMITLSYIINLFSTDDVMDDLLEMITRTLITRRR